MGGSAGWRKSRLPQCFPSQLQIDERLEGREGGGKASDYHWLPLPRDLSPQDEQGLLRQAPARLKAHEVDACFPVCPPCLSFSSALTDEAPRRKQKCSSTQNKTSHGSVCLLTNLRPSQYRAKPAGGAFTLTHKKSKNAVLHTCDLNLQLPHINSAAVMGRQECKRQANAHSAAIALSVSLPCPAAELAMQIGEHLRAGLPLSSSLEVPSDWRQKMRRCPFFVPLWRKKALDYSVNNTV